MQQFAVLRDSNALNEERFDDENVSTTTSTDQVSSDDDFLSIRYGYLEEHIQFVGVCRLFLFCFVFRLSNDFLMKNFLFCFTLTKIEVERLITRCMHRMSQSIFMDPTLPKICRNEHIQFLESGIRSLSTGYECLDSSRPWLVYWILNAAHFLNHTFSDTLLDQVVDFLVKCRSPNGGFGGGPGQYPHLAPTYAAVNSLCIIGTEKAYKAIDR